MNSDVELTASQRGCLDHLGEWKVGAVFMDMGTGKTRVAVEIMASINPRKVLWIGPLRTLCSVREEIIGWGGRDDIRFVGVESIGQSERIYLDLHEWVLAQDGLMVIVDESIKIKNIGAKRTTRVRSLGRHAEYRFILNGTPITKNILDLWAQMDFLSPAILNMPYRRYLNTFCSYKLTYTGNRREMQILDYVNLEYLYSLIDPYVYRCDLTLDVSRNYHKVHFELSDGSREEYHELKQYYLDIETLSCFSDSIFFAMTTAMQMAYCIDEEKFKAVEKLMHGVPDGRFLIFCRYVISHEECQRRFPGVKVLSYQKESFGLNLQAYNRIIYFDKVWDLGLRIQSERRIWRLGQSDDCHYYDLTGDVGLETMMDRNIARKIRITEYFKSKSKQEIAKEL